MTSRQRWASIGIKEFVADRVKQNAYLLSRMGPPKDSKLAQESWKKTEDELRRNIADGPFMSLEEIPLDCPCIVIRKGIWEQHGTATEPSCRNIDDFLISGQNETAGYCSVHIPASVDSLVAQTRSVQDRFPRELLLSWTSDFAKAYRQVPQHPSQVSMTVIAQWHPGLQQVVFVVPYAQLFGGRTLPLHFSRNPAWFTHLLSCAYALPRQHCVDDMVGIDRRSIGHQLWQCWRDTAAVTGWEVPDSKSPAPSAECAALGANLDHRGTPDQPSRVWVTKARCISMKTSLMEAFANKHLGCGVASKLWGRLQALSSQLHARFGRAKLGPIKKRQYKHTTSWTPQLDHAVKWWIAALDNLSPRPVPVTLQLLPTVVTVTVRERAQDLASRCTPLGYHQELPSSRYQRWYAVYGDCKSNGRPRLTSSRSRGLVPSRLLTRGPKCYVADHGSILSTIKEPRCV